MSKILDTQHIGNHFVVFRNGNEYKFIAPECYLSKLKSKKMSDLLNPNMRHELSINTRGFVERVSDIYMTNPDWFKNLPDIPYYFLNLNL